MQTPLGRILKRTKKKTTDLCAPYSGAVGSGSVATKIKNFDIFSFACNLSGEAQSLQPLTVCVHWWGVKHGTV